MDVWILVVFFVILIVAVPLVIFFVVRTKRTSGVKYGYFPQPTLTPAKPTEYGVVVLSSELRHGLVRNCLHRARVMSNNYIYDRGDYVDYYDLEERRDMGEVFENKIRLEMEMYLRSNSKMTLLYQEAVGPGAICDFALVWKDIRNRKRAIIIECKHSNSRDNIWINEQLEKGIDQLYRYGKNAAERRKWRVDLLVLFTSFPWHKGRPAQLIHNVLLINCDSMVGVFMDEVKKFHGSTLVPPTQQSDDFQEDNLNIVG